MIGAMRAALLLGGSSIVAIAMTLVTAKGLAVLVGPRGVGEFALLQSVVDLSVLIAGLGISVSLVRLLADAIDRDDADWATAIRVATRILVWSLGGLAALVLLVFREPIAQAIFGTAGVSGAVVAGAAAVPLTLSATANIGTLSAYREVGAIATIRTFAVVTTAVATLLAVALIGDAGVAVGILLSSVGLWVGASVFLRWRTTMNRWPARSVIALAAKDLVRFGAPYAASSFVGTGIQLAIPILVAIVISTEAAGFYRAATQISAGYLAFIAAAMLQDYYPRLSSEQDRPDVLVALIDQQLKLVMILTIPLILIGIALSGVIVPLLYSQAFQPAVSILGWQLVGTLIRLPSWTLSFAILARGRSRVYFATELVAGGVLLIGSLLGMDRLGLPGLGVAVLLTYLVYYPIVWIAVRRDLPLRVTTAQRALFATTASSIVVQMLPAVGLAAWREPLALTLAAIWVGIAVIAASKIFRHRHESADESSRGAAFRRDRRPDSPADAREPTQLR